MRSISILVIILIFAASASAAGEFLTGKEVRNRLDRGKLAVKTSADYEFSVAMTLKPDGSMEGVSENRYYDIGRWWIKGDLLCHKWNSWFDGFRKCYGVKEKAGGLQLEKPTKVHFTKAKTRLK